MAKQSSKRMLKWALLLVAVVVVVALIGLRYWKAKQAALPPGIASGNGRIEAKLVDVAAKEPLRVKQVLVQEGDLVKPGQVLALLDTQTLEAQLAEAKANVAAAEERLAFANASIVKQRREIELAEVEVKRSENLVRQGAGSQRDLDVRRTRVQTTRASLSQAEALLQTSRQQLEAARASALTVQTRIQDATLRSPVTGRVLYRLAEPGEVLAPGGKVVTLVNLEDVYMEIFLPSSQAARLKLGADARITVDYAPNYAAAGHVSFVSPEAQFTPKQVETPSEREKLMFRVKIQLPRELAAQYIERIKTGIRGVGYVKVDPSATWPARLQNLVPTKADAAPTAGQGDAQQDLAPDHGGVR
jgi:HlyD family secretion protein